MDTIAMVIRDEIGRDGTAISFYTKAELRRPYHVTKSRHAVCITASMSLENLTFVRVVRPSNGQHSFG